MSRLPFRDADGKVWKWTKTYGWIPIIPPSARNKKKRGGRKHKNRHRFHQSFGGLCGLCGLSLHIKDMTEDHVVPKSKGGENYWNLVPAHADCNGRKGNRMPTGCELIALAVVNLRLMEPDHDASPIS